MDQEAVCARRFAKLPQDLQDEAALAAQEMILEQAAAELAKAAREDVSEHGN